MDLINFFKTFEKEDIINILDKYESLGPLPGIFLPMIESFLPFLPLIVILLANAAAYDELWKSFLLSWIGVCTGAFLVFLFTRKFGKNLSSYIQRKYPKGKMFFMWIESKGFTPLFVLSCFPFTPSFLVNIVSGLSKIPTLTFLLAILTGKAFMIFLVSFVGQDIFTVFHNPWKLILTVSLFFLIWILGKSLEARFKKSSQKSH